MKTTLFMPAALLAALAATAPASGQDAVAPPAPAIAATSCEFHVWPAKQSLAMVHYNLYHAGRDKPWLDARLPEPKPISIPRQVELMRSIDFGALFDAPGARVVVHDQPLGRLVSVEASRHVPSNDGCLYEMAVGNFLFESHTQASKSLRLVASFRRFDAGAALPARTFSGSASEKLIIYPARKVEEVPAADAELERAYVNAIARFAQYVKGGPPKR